MGLDESVGHVPFPSFSIHLSNFQNIYLISIACVSFVGRLFYVARTFYLKNVWQWAHIGWRMFLLVNAWWSVGEFPNHYGRGFKNLDNVWTSFSFPRLFIFPSFRILYSYSEFFRIILFFYTRSLSLDELGLYHGQMHVTFQFEMKSGDTKR